MLRPTASPETMWGLSSDHLKLNERSRARLRAAAVSISAILINVFNAAIPLDDDERVTTMVCVQNEADCAQNPSIAASEPLGHESAPSTTIEVPSTTAAPPETIPITTTTEQNRLQAEAANDARVSSRGQIGADQSWPNCDVPIRPDVTFGIVGVNDGRPFETNRCLPVLIAKFRAMGISPALYANTSLDLKQAEAQNDPNVPCPHMNTDQEPLCSAYRWGYRGGQYAVAAAQSAGYVSREWYTDVETGNRWSGDINKNQASFLGTMDAIRSDVSQALNLPDGQVYIAIYSNRHSWQFISGNMKLPAIQTWAATAIPENEVLAACDDPEYNFTGGGIAMVQTVDHTNPGGPIDINLRC